MERPLERRVPLSLRELLEGPREGDDLHHVERPARVKGQAGAAEPAVEDVPEVLWYEDGLIHPPEGRSG